MAVSFRRLVPALSVVTLLATTPTYTYAAPGMLSTESVVAHPDRATSEELSEIKEVVSREEIRQRLQALGVTAEQVENRLASMSPSEIRDLNQRLAVAPAGGDSTVTIGVGTAIIIVILLIVFL